ncbi:META domain-containing protein [Mycobacterium sp. Y57]|uniref:META domain-containing protein n=1 Tax=Mycolicibacterium xanthum TaxID=2796469 RepID=UPI001C8488FA|nr:META domain-containing protein [Mycolicibacterium xanthum]MBX7435085.1 META domain-containing protein [Mycolicibacterium xanthum]
MRLALALAVASTLMACSPASTDTAVTLDDTSWKLTEIQSMDDAQGTTAVPAGQQYTVTFAIEDNGEHRAAFQIDCNRGSSTWQASPSESGDSGSLTFGPIALTMMACPPGSIDQKVSAALGDVRSYLIQDGRLHLSLLADAGILTWEPAEQ